MPALKYDLSALQVRTPMPVLRFYWQLLKQHRPNLGTVLDLGAGDGRFARYGHFSRYLGIEIDRSRLAKRPPRTNAKVRLGCVFQEPLASYDACIGNPPYLKHHDIESPWKEKTLSALSERLGVSLGGHGNLYLYFMALALLQAKKNGLVALIVPFEWTSRPSARAIREAVARERWGVSVYRFRNPIFDDVTTTASVSIIDKARTDASWNVFDVLADFSIVERRGLTGTGKSLLPYLRARGKVFARRGLSPGTQKVFTLTEGERVHNGLWLSDVVPCVTTLRELPSGVGVLDEKTFKAHFVDAGRKCWLIKTRSALSARLESYLTGIPADARSTETCRARVPWYRYEAIDPPRVLLHSGFSGERPKSLLNKIRAIPVGSMYGVYATRSIAAVAIQEFILKSNVIDLIVPNSGRLQKIEVGQLNALLASQWPRNS